jgi:starch synthase
MLRTEDWIPDILHLNDWHTAPLAFALRNLAWDSPVLRGIASVFTIHNLRYRGPDAFNDFLCQAIYYSDAITTVSPTYAREILTPEYGEGLDSLLSLRESSLRGILNGLNYDLFNPRTDPLIPHQFDLTSLDERDRNRTKLRDELHLGDLGGPMAGMVTRLTEQKGVDLVLQALPVFVAAEAQLVVLGDGDEPLKQAMEDLERTYPDNVRFVARFDEALAQRIYGAADIFLMPSRYEPCGLGQIIAMRYGSVPLGRRTGGLCDTIFDVEEHPEMGTGFLFDEFSTHAFSSALERAVTAFRNPEHWRHIQQNGMSRDFSWRASAVHYVETYIQALRSRGIVPLE